MPKYSYAVGRSQAGLIVYGDSNSRRLVLGMADGNKSFLDLFDPRGRWRWSLSGGHAHSR